MGITQNISDFLASPEIENIFKNTECVVLLKQGPGDRDIIAEKLKISHQQMEYVTESEQGCGLLKFGATVIPFTDEFPKDTLLYSLMTTKPSEVFAMQKKISEQQKQDVAFNENLDIETKNGVADLEELLEKEEAGI